MSSSNYEEYMRNVLGYNQTPKDTYQYPEYSYEKFNQRGFETIKLENLYPEIYKLIYPEIQKESIKIGNMINEDIIEKAIDGIYRVIEEKEKRDDALNKRNIDNKTMAPQQTRKIEDNRCRNEMLRDLIKILLLREIMDRPGNMRPPMRPPIPPPPRPYL